jgi:tetratricopeptide (TPR) repeat protein
MLVLILFGWATSGAVRCALGQWHWDKALAQESELAADHWQGADAPFAAMITHAAKAAAWEPDNVAYRHWLNVYRWYSIARVDPEAGHVLVDDQARDCARRIVAELHRARALCPTFGPPLSVAGQIELFFLHDPVGERHIEAGYELARCHPQSCLIAGDLDARRGRWDAAQEKLRRAVSLGQPLEDVLALYLRPEIDRPDLALEIVGGNVYGLTRLSELLGESHRHGEIASAARAQAAAAIKAHAADPSASPYDLASAAQLLAEEKDFDTAAGYYRRALTTEYGHAEWHLSLAQTLARAGKREEAMREARVCLRLHPGTPGARELIEQLSVEPARTAAAKKGPG